MSKACGRATRKSLQGNDAKIDGKHGHNVVQN